MFHDGCTAGPLSEWLNGMISQCCMAHDYALDSGFDFGAFWRANVAMAECAAQVNPLLALCVFLAVSSPVGVLLYRFGPKRQ